MLVRAPEDWLRATNMSGRGNKAGLPGIYKAWLSSRTTDAYCHIQGYDGYTISDNCGQGATLPMAAGPWERTHDDYPLPIL